MQPDLFPDDHPVLPDGAVLLRGFALSVFDDLNHGLNAVKLQAPFRNMTTPGGHTMSVAMTNCGDLGWISDRAGYRYVREDPVTHSRWPEMPPAFVALALKAAAAAGYPFFCPDACLINRYQPGTRLSLHQDRDETDFTQPIVSVSLGLPAQFQFGGPRRRDPVVQVEMTHGDVFVWGGPSRLNFHGVRRIAQGEHPDLGAQRINLTFRRAQ